MNRLRDFHVHIYGPAAGEMRNVGEKPPGTSSVPSSFEEALTRLERDIPSVLLEPDGSLAWASPSHQVVGIIYDAGQRIQYVELRGHCSGDQIRHLIATIADTKQIDEFAVMELPNRQWNNLQGFANSLEQNGE